MALTIGEVATLAGVNVQTLLKVMRSALKALLTSCAANRAHHCPLLEALDEDRAGDAVLRRRRAR